MSENNINDFPIDNELKQLIANLVSNNLERININLTKNQYDWFKDECSEELIANVLETVSEWTKKKLN